jgi:hypothetical protein
MNAPATTTGLNLADLAAIRDDLRTQLKAVQDEEKRLKDLLADNELQIIAQLDEQGVTRSGIGPYSMSISETLVGNVTDWDDVYGYIREHDAFHLLQRRLANAAYGEILESGDSLPGVEPFTKRSLNFRKSSAK